MGGLGSLPRDLVRTVTRRDPSSGWLPERFALDLTLANLEQGRTGAVLVITRSATAAREVLLRFATPLAIVAHTEESARDVREIVASGIHPDPDGVTVSTFGDFDAVACSPVESVLWLMPTHDTLEDGVALVHSAMAARIAVIGNGPLHRIRLGMSRARYGRRARAVDPFSVGAGLGFDTEQEWWLLGLRSAFNAPVALLARRLGRWDVADRADAGYRLSLIESGRPRLWGVGVWIGRRTMSS
jgi:hypothetical protein